MEEMYSCGPNILTRHFFFQYIYIRSRTIPRFFQNDFEFITLAKWFLSSLVIGAAVCFMFVFFSAFNSGVNELLKPSCILIILCLAVLLNTWTPHLTWEQDRMNTTFPVSWVFLEGCMPWNLKKCTRGLPRLPSSKPCASCPGLLISLWTVMRGDLLLPCFDAVMGERGRHLSRCTISFLFLFREADQSQAMLRH